MTMSVWLGSVCAHDVPHEPERLSGFDDPSRGMRLAVGYIFFYGMIDPRCHHNVDRKHNDGRPFGYGL